MSENASTDQQGLPALHIRGKFYLQGLELLPGQQGVRVRMSPVSRGDRNAQWASATPIGSIDMTINNGTTASHLEEFMQASRRTGKQPELFVDFSPSTDGWPGDGHAFRLSQVTDARVYGYGKCGECGLDKDADVLEWDEVTRSQVVRGKAHPNG